MGLIFGMRDALLIIFSIHTSYITTVSVQHSLFYISFSNNLVSINGFGFGACANRLDTAEKGNPCIMGFSWIMESSLKILSCFQFFCGILVQVNSMPHPFLHLNFIVSA